MARRLRTVRIWASHPEQDALRIEDPDHSYDTTPEEFDSEFLGHLPMTRFVVAYILPEPRRGRP